MARCITRILGLDIFFLQPETVLVRRGTTGEGSPWPLSSEERLARERDQLME